MGSGGQRGQGARGGGGVAGKPGGAAPTSAQGPILDPADLLYLIDDDGAETPHELLHVLKLGGKRYAVLLAALVDPQDPDGPPRGAVSGDAAQLSFWLIRRDPEGEEILLEIQSPREGRRVARAWTRYLDARGAWGRVV